MLLAMLANLCCQAPCRKALPQDINRTAYGFLNRRCQLLAELSFRLCCCESRCTERQINLHIFLAQCVQFCAEAPDPE